MATIDLSCSSGGSSTSFRNNSRLRVEYSLSSSGTTITELYGWRTDSYHTYDYDQGSCNINLAGNSKNVTIEQVDFGASSSAKSFGMTDTLWSGVYGGSITVTMPSSGSSFSGAVYTGTISRPSYTVTCQIRYMDQYGNYGGYQTYSTATVAYGNSTTFSYGGNDTYNSCSVGSGTVTANKTVQMSASRKTGSFNLNIIDPNGDEPYSTGAAGSVERSINGGSYERKSNEDTNSYYVGTTFAYRNFSPGTGMKLGSVSGVSPSNTSGPWSATMSSSGLVVSFNTVWQTYYRDINAWKPGNTEQNGLIFDYYIYNRDGTLVNSYTNKTNEVADTVTREYGFTGKIKNIRTNVTGAHYTTNNITNSGASEFTWTYNTDTAIELYSAWNTYTVVYNSNGGAGSMDNTNATYNTAFNLRANTFTRRGFTFLGWSTSSTATSATYGDKASVNNLTTTHGGTVTLYAVWRLNALPSTSLSIGNITPTSVTLTPTAAGTLHYVRNLPIYYQDMPIKVLNDGSVWARVYYHDSQGGTVLWSSVSEAKNTQTTNKYSRLGLLSDSTFKGSDNKLELMLTYPTYSASSYNRWKQTNNPCDVYTGTGEGTKVPGYEAISISWSGSGWGGLERSSSDTSTITYTYIDGSVGFSNWWFAIAPKDYYQGGLPGPSAIIYRQCEIWARVPNVVGQTATISANTPITLSGIADESDWYFCAQTTNSTGVAYSTTQRATTPVDQAKSRIKRPLPAEYERLTYIETNGAQYIDTNITMKTNTTIDCRFEVVDKVNDYLFGQTQNNSSMMYSGLYNASIYEYGWSAYNYPPADFVYMTQSIDGSNLITTINNTTFTTPINTTLPSGTTKIFMCNDNRYYSGKARVYFFVMREGNTTVREMYPCKRVSDNAIGMYDMITKQFYPNKGTGSFTAGPITDWIKGKTYYKKDGQWIKAKKVYIKINNEWKVGNNYDPE